MVLCHLILCYGNNIFVLYLVPCLCSHTAKADIQFTFPVMSEEEEEMRLILNWKAAKMSDISLVGEDGQTDDSVEDTDSLSAGLTIPPLELLMFALPHHQERVRPTEGSSNVVKDVGCQPNLHGVACPVSSSLLLIFIYLPL